MIRMGRGNKPDQAGGSDYQEQPSEPAYRYASEVAQPGAARTGGAISESDSMARDIKEGRLSGFVGHGTTLTGETAFHAMLRVDGHLIGTVSSESGTLIIGTNGQVDANIVVAAAMIGGTVNGDIVATEKLQLGRTARVMGNIQSPRLIVEEGAILEGSCSMLKARETAEEASAAAPAIAEEESRAAAARLPGVGDDEDDADAYLTDEDEEDDTTVGAASA